MLQCPIEQSLTSSFKLPQVRRLWLSQGIVSTALWHSCLSAPREAFLVLLRPLLGDWLMGSEELFWFRSNGLLQVHGLYPVLVANLISSVKD